MRNTKAPTHNLNRPGWPWTTPRQPDRLSLRSPASVQPWCLLQVISFSGDNILYASLLLKPWKRTVIIDLARTCKIANEERHGIFRSPATARPPIRSTRRGRERFLVWILSYCYNFIFILWIISALNVHTSCDSVHDSFLHATWPSDQGGLPLQRPFKWNQINSKLFKQDCCCSFMIIQCTLSASDWAIWPSSSSWAPNKCFFLSFTRRWWLKM